MTFKMPTGAGQFDTPPKLIEMVAAASAGKMPLEPNPYRGTVIQGLPKALQART